MDTNQGRERRRFMVGAGTAGLSLATGVAHAQVAPGAVPGSADGALHIPAHDVPAPMSVSPAARAFLSKMGAMPTKPEPGLRDLAAWKATIAEQDAVMSKVADGLLSIPGITTEARQIGGAKVYVSKAAKGHQRPHLYLHGGAFALFAGKPTMGLTHLQSVFFGGVVYGVDYRMAPDHPAPAALDDCIGVYRELLKSHPAKSILVSGESAGGNLAAALMHRARDEGLPPPGALFLNTPAVDLTKQGDTLKTNAYVDVTLKTSSSEGGTPALYIGSADAKHPYLSPLFGDVSRGFPPTYLRSGTRDLLLSDTVRMHAALRRAGVDADLFVAEAMPHSGLGGYTPEDAEARADTKRWLDKHWTE